jgi:hypothetical protein
MELPVAPFMYLIAPYPQSSRGEAVRHFQSYLRPTVSSMQRSLQASRKPT